jgi:quercetin dioxygenase-like cupin family protein
MRTSLTFAALVFCLSSPALAQQNETSGENAQAHHLVVPLTSKGLSGIVSGDPTKPGAQYVIRMYNDPGFIVLPHWHPEDEHITVVKGQWYLGTGDTFDPHAMRELNVGDYALVPKHMAHFAWSKTETIILIHGIGPFQVTNTDAQQSLSGWTIDPQKGLYRDPQSISNFKFKLNERVRSARGSIVNTSLKLSAQHPCWCSATPARTRPLPSGPPGAFIANEAQSTRGQWTLVTNVNEMTKHLRSITTKIDQGKGPLTLSSTMKTLSKREREYRQASRRTGSRCTFLRFRGRRLLFIILCIFL